MRKGSIRKGQLGPKSLLLAAVAALALGILFGLVSSWIDSLRLVVLIGLALALLGWCLLWVDGFVKAPAQRGPLQRRPSKARILTGPVLAAAVGLAAVDDVTLGLFLVLVLVVLSRKQTDGVRRN